MGLDDAWWVFDVPNAMALYEIMVSRYELECTKCRDFSAIKIC